MVLVSPFIMHDSLLYINISLFVSAVLWLFLQNINKLKHLLGQKFDIRERRFETLDGIDSLGDKPFVSPAYYSCSQVVARGIPVLIKFQLAINCLQRFYLTVTCVRLCTLQSNSQKIYIGILQILLSFTEANTRSKKNL